MTSRDAAGDGLAVEVRALHKRYGDVEAVSDVSFEIRRGEIFTLVGPNGAGKTTTIECVQGLRAPSGGTIRVLDLEPQRDGAALRQRIGVQLQTAALPQRIRVWEALDLFASFYRRRDDLRALAERVGIDALRGRYIAELSGGQRQRMFIALALVNRPEVVFLDELTTGLDPQARRSVWDLVREIRARGATVFLTTHFMEEAERLSDRVAVLDQGRIVAIDAPRGLIDRYAGERRVVVVFDGHVEPALVRSIGGVRDVVIADGQLTFSAPGDGAVGDLVTLLATQGCRVRTVRSTEPTLEDVFLALTGRGMRD